MKTEAIELCKLINPNLIDDLIEIFSLASSFQEDYARFMSEKKLIISVTGVVKAGKSSFLNCLLFNGRNLLPKAITPMTAVLTIIEFSESNRAEIIFFNKEEFQSLAKLIREKGSEEEKEKIPKLKNKIPKNNRIKIITANTPEELLSKISRFISSEKDISYIIKEINIKINYPSLKKFKIVDTPGLNDPVISRSYKTKEFIKMSHVVFHLSRASQFLEREDIELIARYAQESIQKIHIIASKYDETLKELHIQKVKSLKQKSILKKGLNLLERIKNSNSRSTKVDFNIDQTIHELKEKLSERIENLIRAGVIREEFAENLKNFGLFSALFLKAEKGTLDKEEKEIFERLISDLELKFNKSLLEYSGIKQITNHIEEVEKRYNEIVEKSKREFIEKQKERFLDIYRNLNLILNSMLKENENSLIVLNYINFIMNDTIDTFKKNISSLLEELNISYNKTVDKAIKHIEEGIKKLSISTETKVETKEKTIWKKRNKKKFCIFEVEEKYKQVIPVQVETKYINIDDSIDKVKKLIKKAIRTYKTQLFQSGLRKEIIKENIKRETESYFNKIINQVEIKIRNSNLEHSLLENITTTKENLLLELERILDKLTIPDPLDFQFPERKFRKELENIKIENAEKVYKELLTNLLRNLKRDIKFKSYLFEKNLELLKEQIFLSVRDTVKQYQKSVNYIINNRSEVEKAITKLNQILKDLKDYLETETNLVTKTRVFQLAEELGISPKELLKILREDFDIKVKSENSILNERQVKLIKEFIVLPNKKKAGL